ncbi:MAG TPA: SPOR domain-containing protein [Gemmobacter sp.]|nr:SPOR domain-containing protein [Gemmobacter sp.]
MALWDGRPSLGGVWVASPEAQDPERVILRNSENGKFVIGALFRRERDNPGPTLQISSDAAAALGLLAGQPARVSVTALRREENPASTDASKPLLDVAETAEGEAPGAGTVPEVLPKQAAIATAPVAATAAEPPAAAKPAAPAPTAKPAAAAKPAATTGGAHVLQIGIFSVEANATRAAEVLRKAGLAATIRPGQTQGKAHWSVTASGNDREALLAKAKSLGFADAYFVKN